MPANGRRVHKLAEYTVERRADGWHFGRSARYVGREEMKGPYSSISSLTLVIAGHLKRKIPTRDAPHATPV
jgi:hypothetical protein